MEDLSGVFDEELSLEGELSLGSLENLSECEGDDKRRRLNEGDSPPRPPRPPPLLNCTCMPTFFTESATKDAMAFNRALPPTEYEHQHDAAAASLSRSPEKKEDGGLKNWLDDVMGSPQQQRQRHEPEKERTSSSSSLGQCAATVAAQCCPSVAAASLAPALEDDSKKKKRTSSQRSEVVKKRNRAHAQATRRRQKMYVEYLKSQVEELSVVNASSDAHAYQEIPDEPKKSKRRESKKIEPSFDVIDESIRQKATALKFLEFRTSRVKDRDSWADLLADSCVVTAPTEPFRPLVGHVDEVRSLHVLRGVEACMADAASMCAFVDSVDKRLGRKISMRYRVASSDLMLFGTKLMCHWSLATSGLTSAGFPREVSVDGMMKASFNGRSRLEHAEFIYDVSALVQGFTNFNLIDSPSRVLASPAPSDLATVAADVAPVVARAVTFDDANDDDQSQGPDDRPDDDDQSEEESVLEAAPAPIVVDEESLRKIRTAKANKKKQQQQQSETPQIKTTEVAHNPMLNPYQFMSPYVMVPMLQPQQLMPTMPPMMVVPNMPMPLMQPPQLPGQPPNRIVFHSSY